MKDPIDSRECDHSAATPAFDEEAAKGLPSHEVRRRWPRFAGPCPACGEKVIVYASMAQYVYGDY